MNDLIVKSGKHVSRRQLLADYLPPEARPAYRQYRQSQWLDAIAGVSVLVWCAIIFSVITGSMSWEWLLSGVGVVGLLVGAYHADESVRANHWIPQSSDCGHYFIKEQTIDNGGVEMYLVEHRLDKADIAGGPLTTDTHYVEKHLVHSFASTVSSNDLAEYRDMLLTMATQYNKDSR